MVTLVQLRMIDPVRRHGSLTAPAKEPQYTQPSSTNHLSRLQPQLVARLLRRSGRGVRLTPAGRLLAGWAVEMISRVDIASAKMSALVWLNAGRVWLAGFSSVMSSLIPQAATVLG